MSWIVVSRATGKAIYETFNAEIAAAIDQSRYEVLPAGDYLSRLNSEIKSKEEQCKIS